MHLNPNAKCRSSKLSLKSFIKKKSGGHLKPENTLVRVSFIITRIHFDKPIIKTEVSPAQAYQMSYAQHLVNNEKQLA